MTGLGGQQGRQRRQRIDRLLLLKKGVGQVETGAGLGGLDPDGLGQQGGGVGVAALFQIKLAHHRQSLRISGARQQVCAKLGLSLVQPVVADVERGALEGRIAHRRARLLQISLFRRLSVPGQEMEISQRLPGFGQFRIQGDGRLERAQGVGMTAKARQHGAEFELGGRGFRKSGGEGLDDAKRPVEIALPPDGGGLDQKNPWVPWRDGEQFSRLKLGAFRTARQVGGGLGDGCGEGIVLRAGRAHRLSIKQKGDQATRSSPPRRRFG